MLPRFLWVSAVFLAHLDFLGPFWTLYVKPRNMCSFYMLFLFFVLRSDVCSVDCVQSSNEPCALAWKAVGLFKDVQNGRENPQWSATCMTKRWEPLGQCTLYRAKGPWLRCKWHSEQFEGLVWCVMNALRKGRCLATSRSPGVQYTTYLMSELVIDLFCEDWYLQHQTATGTSRENGHWKKWQLTIYIGCFFVTWKILRWRTRSRAFWRPPYLVTRVKIRHDHMASRQIRATWCSTCCNRLSTTMIFGV